MAVLFTLNFSRNRGSGKKIAGNLFLVSASFTAISFLSYIESGEAPAYAFFGSVFQMGTLLSLPLLSRYNGKKGELLSRVPGGRLFFYWFYPVHLIILGALKAIT